MDLNVELDTIETESATADIDPSENCYELYQCKECGKVFSLFADFEKHNHNNIPWNCKECCIPFPSKSKYKEHFKAVHTEKGKKPFPCKICMKEFASDQYLRLHYQLVHSKDSYLPVQQPLEWKCEQCGRVFAAKGNWKHHMVVVHSNERPWKCTQCEKRFKCKGDMNKHALLHSDIRKFPCTYCTKAYTRLTYLTRHLRTHTGEKPFECDICKKHFSRSEKCKDHRRIHTGERPLICHCGKTFNDSGNFCKHKKTHLPKIPKPEKNGAKGQKATTKDSASLSARSGSETILHFVPSMVTSPTSFVQNSKVENDIVLERRAEEEMIPGQSGFSVISSEASQDQHFVTFTLTRDNKIIDVLPTEDVDYEQEHYESPKLQLISLPSSPASIL